VPDAFPETKAKDLVTFPHPDPGWAEKLKITLRSAGSELAPAISAGDFIFDVQFMRLKHAQTSEGEWRATAEQIEVPSLSQVDELLAPLFDKESHRIARGDEVRTRTLERTLAYMKYTKVKTLTQTFRQAIIDLCLRHSPTLPYHSCKLTSHDGAGKMRT